MMYGTSRFSPNDEVALRTRLRQAGVGLRHIRFG